MEKRKIDFQDGHHGSHLGFPIETILAVFDLQVTPMLLTKFQVNWPFGSGEKAKIRFSRLLPYPPSWISDRNDFSYFWSTRHPDASYQVSSQLAFWFRRRSENRFFKMAAIAATLDFWLERFKLFLIYKSPLCFLPSFKSTGLSVQEEKQKMDFNLATMGTSLDFRLELFMDLQVTLMLPTKFRVNLFNGSGGVVKNMKS